MFVSLRWLKEYVDISLGSRALAERLTMAGIKVEGVHEPQARPEGAVVGRIVDVRPHPDAETLRICSVDVGGRVLQAVTGAPNAAAGMLVAAALPGATLPGIEGTVREASLRGVRSECVLCSERELGVSDDHSGLMELPADLPLGADVAAALGFDDAVFEFEVYANRPDCLSVVGLAREVAAVTGGELRLPPAEVPEGGGEARSLASVAIEAPDLCSRYIARVIRNVRVGPSPSWMQERLRKAGMRPINNVVDITNYVMLELGQPLHAFDYDRLRGRKIVVRRAKDGETLETLDGVVRRLTPDELLICDGEGPVALAGIMGGSDSEVQESTRNILLEAATFAPANVRRSSRRLGLHTEASHRFEKGLDPRLAEWAADRAARLMAELAGGEVARGRVDVHFGLPPEREMEVRPDRINGLLGTELSPAEMKRILKGLGFQVDLGKGAATIRVRVPWFRRDVEGEADVAEEIARIHGYEQIEPTLPTGASVQGKLSWPLPVLERIRTRLVALGISESLTYSFISPKGYDRLRLPAEHPWRRSIPLMNPLSEAQSVMRTTFLPSLLEAVALNQRRHQPDVRLFEIGRVYWAERLPLAGLPDEVRTLGLVLTGRVPAAWGDPARAIDFFDAKGAVDAVLRLLGVEARYERADEPFLHPGRSAVVFAGDERVGWVGEIHPTVAANFDLRGRVYAAELNLDALASRELPVPRFVPLPKFPAVERDLALLVPASLASESVAAVIRREGGRLLQRVELFDLYEGKQVPQGYRSLAYTLTFRAEDRTLTDDEVAAVQEQIAKALVAELGVEVRG